MGADERARHISEENTIRDVFALSCKKFTTLRLEQWQMLRDQKTEIASNSLGRRLFYINDYIAKFERTLLEHIYSIIDVIDSKLIPHSSAIETKIFYYKMLADYFRYTVDFFDKDECQEYVDAVSEALANYKYSMELATRHLQPTSPIFLALVLNYSVFLNDMQNDVYGAIEVANEAFTEALGGLKYLDEDDHKESTVLLQLLRDNLQLWKHSAAVDDGEEPQGDAGMTTEEPEIEYD